LWAWLERWGWCSGSTFLLCSRILTFAATWRRMLQINARVMDPNSFRRRFLLWPCDCLDLRINVTVFKRCQTKQHLALLRVFRSVWPFFWKIR
jgi:hypothetical protein